MGSKLLEKKEEGEFRECLFLKAIGIISARRASRSKPIRKLVLARLGNFLAYAAALDGMSSIHLAELILYFKVKSDDYQRL